MPVETTANYIRVRVAENEKFNRFRVETLSSGIKAVRGYINQVSKIQSILFSRERYDMKAAKTWVVSHGYKVNETLLVYDIIIDPKTFDLTFIEESVTETEESAVERPKVKPWAWLLDDETELTGFDM
ncbi:MAG: hypothetical protein ABSA76_15495 [Bacteroidales bacterium]|jgi:hypothetical protein